MSNRPAEIWCESGLYWDYKDDWSEGSWRDHDNDWGEKYVRADRIEELEAQRNFAQRQVVIAEAKLAKAVSFITYIEAGPSWGESLPSWVNTLMLKARTILAELKGQE